MTTHDRSRALALALALAACSSGARMGGMAPTPGGPAPMPAPALDAAEPAPAGGTDAAMTPPAPADAAVVTVPPIAPPGGPGPDATVTAFSGTHVYYASGMDNKRTIDAPATFPEMPLTYQKITLDLALRCPPEGCDYWDRRAFIGVVHGVALRAFISGHGQGNRDNCAEFCPRTHTFTVGTTPFPRMLWRDDCATSSAPNQLGNFRSPRAGWCPGAFVAAWVSDVSPAVTRDGPTSIAYDVTAYENTCRPDAPVCSCGPRCPYDNGGHTSPFYEMSAALIVYAR